MNPVPPPARGQSAYAVIEHGTQLITLDRALQPVRHENGRKRDSSRRRQSLSLASADRSLEAAQSTQIRWLNGPIADARLVVDCREADRVGWLGCVAGPYRGLVRQYGR